MFNSLFNKVKNIWIDTGQINTQPSQKETKQEKPVVQIETKESDQKKNRVSLKQTKKNKVDINKRVDEIVKKEFEEKEREIFNRLKSLNDKEKYLLEKERNLDNLSEQINKKRDSVDDLYKKQLDKLEQISTLSVAEAKNIILKNTEKRMADWIAKKIVEAKEEIKKKEDEIIQNMVLDGIHHGVTDYVAEYTISTIEITDEKIKGKIIGREGRNIRAFEKLTGVDVIIDESPNTIALSSFDPLRREIATVALNKLIGDGRIHPSSIEEAIRKAKNEISIEIKKNGEILAEEAGWPGIDIGLIKLLGKMKYRTSYGQSLMSHTIEVIRIGEVLAAELGADVDLVKKACLLHDIGKVLSHKIDSPHHHISGQIARKYGLDEKLVNAIEAHHLDIEPQSVEAVIVYLADAISGARPGARKDSYEQYIQRIEALENAAKEVGGDKIDEVFAIRAGRELRVIVKPNLISDDEMTVLAKDLAETIEKTQNYPGNVEVTLIRETRAVEIAK